MNQKQQVLAALNYAVDGQTIQANYDGVGFTNGVMGQLSGGSTTASNQQYTLGSANSVAQNALYIANGDSLWKYWHQDYYPHVIKESYPVYIQERAMDKGKQAFEILKALMDKGLVKVDKVKDFIEAMDVLLKTL